MSNLYRSGISASASFLWPAFHSFQGSRCYPLSGEEHCKNAVDEGLTLSVRFEGALVLAEQENRSAVSLSEEVLAHVLAAPILELNG